MAAPLSDMLPMPNPRDKGSLHFKGRDIDVFLSKFEYHADRAHLTEIQRCEFIRLYFSKKEEFLDILEGFRCRNWDQLKEELWSMYSSSCSSGGISPYAETYEPEYDRESKSYAASDLEPSAGLCDMCGESPHDIVECRETRFRMFLGICDLDRDGRVVMRDGSALPLAEGEGVFGYPRGVPVS